MQPHIGEVEGLKVHGRTQIEPSTDPAERHAQGHDQYAARYPAAQPCTADKQHQDEHQSRQADDRERESAKDKIKPDEGQSGATNCSKQRRPWHELPETLREEGAYELHQTATCAGNDTRVPGDEVSGLLGHSIRKRALLHRVHDQVNKDDSDQGAGAERHCGRVVTPLTPAEFEGMPSVERIANDEPRRRCRQHPAVKQCFAEAEKADQQHVHQNQVGKRAGTQNKKAFNVASNEYFHGKLRIRRRQSRHVVPSDARNDRSS